MQSRLQPKNWTIRLIIIVVVIVILLISIISNLWYFTDCSEMITPISNVSFARIFSKKEKRLHRSSIRLEIIQRSRATPYFLLLSRGFTLGWSPFFQDSVSRFTVWKRYFIYIYPSRSSWPRDEKVWLLSGLEITKNIRGRLITGVDNKWNVLLRRTRDPPKRMHRGSFEHTRVSPYLVLRSLDLLSFRPKRFHPPPPMVDSCCWLNSDKLVPWLGYNLTSGRFLIKEGRDDGKVWKRFGYFEIIGYKYM